MQNQIVKSLEQIVQTEMSSSGTVQEKLDFLSQLVEDCTRICKETKENLLLGYTYCKLCDQFYRNETWKTETRVEEGTYVHQPLAEFDNSEERSCLYKVTTKTCPVGHVISESEEY